MSPDVWTDLYWMFGTIILGLILFVGLMGLLARFAPKVDRDDYTDQSGWWI